MQLDPQRKNQLRIDVDVADDAQLTGNTLLIERKREYVHPVLWLAALNWPLFCELDELPVSAVLELHDLLIWSLFIITVQ